MSRSGEEIAILKRLLNELDSCLAYLGRKSHGDEDPRFHIHGATIAVTTLGPRQLKAALGNIECGWEPESAAHVRSAW